MHRSTDRGAETWLVAHGLSNPEIGSRLFMSRGTVKTHLSHVYAKLGVANRTELATLASRINPGWR
jgi:DNA-binding CsgD family transcriptional regulator